MVKLYTPRCMERNDFQEPHRVDMVPIDDSTEDDGQYVEASEYRALERGTGAKTKQQASGCTIEQLRALIAIQAEDDALWSAGVHIETAYLQQGLRFITRAIEGEWSFDEAREALKDLRS